MMLKLAEHLKPLRPLQKPHRGVVIDNVDPKGLQRVKVEIKGVFEGDKTKLPWVFKENADPNKHEVPKIGEELIITFPYDDIYHPFYVGKYTTEKNKDDYFSGDPNISGFYKDNLKGKFNDETKEGELIHSSGTSMSISDDGSITASINKDLALAIKGDGSISSDGKFNISAKAGLNFTTDGKAVFSGKGGTDVGDSGSVTNVNGTQVLLANGGNSVAVVGSDVISQSGNAGAPVLSKVMTGSSKVFAPL